MNPDSVLITDGGAWDTGAFHRAMEVARDLFEAGRWDGNTPLRIVDPYHLHGEYAGLQPIWVFDLVLTWVNGEMVVSLPQMSEFQRKVSGRAARMWKDMEIARYAVRWGK